MSTNTTTINVSLDDVAIDGVNVYAEVQLELYFPFVGSYGDVSDVIEDTSWSLEGGLVDAFEIGLELDGDSVDLDWDEDRPLFTLAEGLIVAYFETPEGRQLVDDAIEDRMVTLEEARVERALDARGW